MSKLNGLNVDQLYPASALALLELEVRHEAELSRLASVVAQHSPPVGFERLSILLKGDLGAGKTTFARQLLRCLGITERVKSPSYAIVEYYTAPAPVPAPTPVPPAVAIAHFDLYRLRDPQEIEAIGLLETLAAPGLKLIEWPEKGGALERYADLDIQFDITSASSRRLRLQPLSAAGFEIVSACQQLAL